MGHHGMLNTFTEAQITQDQEKIDSLHMRWMIGQTTALNEQDLPKSIDPALDNMPSDRRAVLTLALLSQQSMLYRFELPPHQVNALKPYPLLPEITKPILPENQRGLFRRILGELGHYRDNPALLLNLLLHRGYVAHPADWLPKTTPKADGSWDDNLPDIYLPWLQWASNALVEERFNDDEVTEDNWDEWYPAQRVRALTAQRKTTPNAARELIEHCVGKEPAEKRVKIIATLAVNLSEEDANYLKSLSNDRSQKVVALAKQLLMRLGIWQTDKTEGASESPEDIAKELAKQYDIKKSGLIKKTVQLLPVKLKSKKQAAIRTEQLLNVSIMAFCDALDMDVTSLINAWKFKDNRESDNQNFVTNLSNTLADSHMPELLAALIKQISHNLDDMHLLHILLPRLTAKQLTNAISKLLTQTDTQIGFDHCLELLEYPLDDMSVDVLKATKAWKRLVSAVKKELKNNGYMDNYHIEQACLALGYMLPQTTATAVLDALCELGMLRADPVLNVLKLNAELKNTEA